MNRAESEGEQLATGRTTDQSTNQAELEVRVRMVLADMFKDGPPDWLPVLDRKGESSDAGAIIDATIAQLPARTSSTHDPVGNHFGQQSLLDPEIPNVCAEAIHNGFQVLTGEGGSSDSGAIVDATTAQLPANTSSVHVPVGNQFEQRSPFKPGIGDECAVAFQTGFPLLTGEGESNDFDSLMLPAHVGNDFGQPSFDDPLMLDSENTIEWGRYLSDFLQN